MTAPGLDYTVAAVIWLAVIAYAVLAGADFGGGVWDLLGIGPRGDSQRRAVSRAMGPVWEANHVWLIFAITGLFTGFPRVFAVLATRLYLPFSLILLGIVFRGAAFAFRAHAVEAAGIRTALGRVFGIASAVTPFLLGACAGAVASGRVSETSAFTGLDSVSPWTTPFALVCGALALAICAGLAAAYLAVEESALGETRLAEDFRTRALGAGAAAGVLAVAALPLTSTYAPGLFSGLTGRALPVTAIAFLLAVGAGFFMYTRRYRLARFAIVGQIAAILGGWAIAQAPYILPPSMTVEGTASPVETMVLLLWVTGLGGLLLVPSLALLFHVFKGRNPAVT